MNNGAFGENFPYTNFHDLNMDWIIKIAKDFLDQYTHIQETITTGLEDLDTKATELETLLQEWYDTHSEDIATQLASALEELNTLLQTDTAIFNQRVNEKLADTLADIPDDYTELGRNVNTIKDSDLIRTKNVFDKDARTDGYYVSHTTGELIENSDFCTSDYIPTWANQTFTGNYTNHIAFYDGTKTFISGYNQTFPATTPAGTRFIRIDINKTVISPDEVMLVHGNTLPSTYIPYLTPKVEILRDATMKKGRNLFDPTTVTWGMNVSSTDGTLGFNSNFFVSDFIPVKGDTYYTGIFSNHLSFYDTNKAFISGTNTEYSVKSPSNARYARIDNNFTTYSIDEVILVEGVGLINYENKYLPIVDEWLNKAIYISKNLFDKTTITDGKYLQWRGGDSRIIGELLINSDFAVSDYFEVEENTTYTGNFTNHIVFFDENKTGLQGTNAEYTVTSPANAKYARIDFNKTLITADQIMVVKGNRLPEFYIPHFIIEPDNKDNWIGKNMLFYGDSITAQSNGDTPTGWTTYIFDKFALNSVRGRGVGSQRYVWNTDTFKVDENGNYVSRGGADDNCFGCFCSWQRISSMIPDSIKNSIDCIVIMGGTNDLLDGVNTIYETPVWSADNTTDTQWGSAPEYNGGDYNVNTFSGAIASTIMKMQTRCPNATIILATPLSRYSTTTKAPSSYDDNNTITMADAEIKVAKYLNIPHIDITTTDGINAFNFTTYITDGVHPNAEGRKMLASAMISGLEHIFHKI